MASRLLSDVQPGVACRMDRRGLRAARRTPRRTRPDLVPGHRRRRKRHRAPAARDPCWQLFPRADYVTASLTGRHPSVEAHDGDDRSEGLTDAEVDPAL